MLQHLCDSDLERQPPPKLRLRCGEARWPGPDWHRKQLETPVRCYAYARLARVIAEKVPPMEPHP